MPADHDLAEYLEDQGLGTVGISIFTGKMPAGVINAISLTQYPGEAPELTMGSNGLEVEKPRVQVVVRHSTTATAFENARLAAIALSKIGNQVIEGVRYRSVTVLQTPGQLMRDAQDRPLISFHIAIEKDSAA